MQLITVLHICSSTSWILRRSWVVSWHALIKDELENACEPHAITLWWAPRFDPDFIDRCLQDRCCFCSCWVQNRILQQNWSSFALNATCMYCIATVLPVLYCLLLYARIPDRVASRHEALNTYCMINNKMTFCTCNRMHAWSHTYPFKSHISVGPVEKQTAQTLQGIGVPLVSCVCCCSVPCVSPANAFLCPLSFLSTLSRNGCLKVIMKLDVFHYRPCEEGQA